MKRIVIGIMVFINLCFVATSYADLNEGLIAYYPFDNYATDETGNGHDGIVKGATWVEDRNGKPNSAYSFDGVNDYIKIEHQSDLNVTEDFTISFWVNRQTDSGTSVMMAKGRDCSNSYFFGWGGPNAFRVSYGKRWCGMTGVGTKIPAYEWHLVSVVIDNTNLKLRYYLDGLFAKETVISPYQTTNGYPLVIGRHFTSANGTGGYEYYFKGMIDELRFYDRALEDGEIEALYTFGNPQIEIVYPKISSVQKSGDQVVIAWNSKNMEPSDEIMISMKRLSVPIVQLGPNNQNWHEFTLEDSSNDGYEIVTIPEGIESGDDWHFYIKHVDSEAWDSTDQVFEISETKRNWGVPYVYQRAEVYNGNMSESACGPSSVTMLLQYYYPNSQIEMPVIYHSGTQTYEYDSGPANVYQNVSFAFGDSGLSIIDNLYKSYYVGSYSGMTKSYMEKYLYNIWNIQMNTSLSLNQEDVYEKIEEGPLLGHVYAHGQQSSDDYCDNPANPYDDSWKHYVVIKGIETFGTTDRYDDIIYINDPYNIWNSVWDSKGDNKMIPYSEFFEEGAYCGGKWFWEAFQLISPDTPIERLYSLIVDTGHNDFEGYGNSHVFTLFNETEKVETGEPIWKFYYGDGGDWYYPTESGQSARWTPEISVNGYYQVEVKYRADSGSGIVSYDIYDSDASILVSVDINQSNTNTEWTTSLISSAVYLEDGFYVEASNIPVNTNIDAIKFKFLHH